MSQLSLPTITCSLWPGPVTHAEKAGNQERRDLLPFELGYTVCTQGCLHLQNVLYKSAMLDFGKGVTNSVCFNKCVFYIYLNISCKIRPTKLVVLV